MLDGDYLEQGGYSLALALHTSPLKKQHNKNNRPPTGRINEPGDIDPGDIDPGDIDPGDIDVWLAGL